MKPSQYFFRNLSEIQNVRQKESEQFCEIALTLIQKPGK